MKLLRYIILIVFSLVALLSCTKKEWCPLTEIDKQMIPYKMGDTIRFIDENGNPSLLIVDKDVTEEQYWDRAIEHFYEFWELRLFSERDNTKFSLFIDGLSPKSVSVVVWKPRATYSMKYDSKGSFKNFGDGNTRYFYDSIEINNYVYHNVAMKEEWRDGIHGRVYYNTNYGILQVKEGEKAIFTLVP